MNQKLTFQDLAAQLAAASGQSQSFSEDFIKELFNAVSEALSQGDTVKIKGLGEFKPSADSPDRLIFTPDETLAEKVNAPFSQFAPAKLNPEVTDDRLVAVEDMDAHDEDVSEPEVEEDNISVSEPISVTETEIPSSMEAVEEMKVIVPSDDEQEQSESNSEETIEVVEAPEEPVKEPTSVIPEIIPIEEDEEEIFTGNEFKSRPVPPPFQPVQTVGDEQDTVAQPEPENKSAGFGMGFFVGLIVGIAVGAAAMFFYATSLTPSRAEAPEPDEETGIADEVTDVSTIADTAWTDNDTVSPSAPAVDPVPEEQPEPVAAAPATPVTDKVKAGYLMPKMAQKHYGNQVFWVYIYEENKTKISNPNTLPAGIELVIPAPEKYGIDANDPASVARAQAKEAELWNKK
ncbi:MAG: HU family DNA-binding protein [Duncaniella sp.]|nr:HU family DNA-binding protein [Duncaniella sp.]